MTAKAVRADLPHVTAIVLNWCGEADTASCLDSLRASDYPALRVLLVDNGSPDGSGERLRAAYPWAGYLQTGKNLGYTGGNNRGVARALADGCDYVLVLNNDTWVEPDAVGELVSAALQAPDVGAVGGKILYADAPDCVWFGGGDLSRSRGMGYHRGEGEKDADAAGGPVERVTFLTGCCLLVPAAVFREVGGFEEDYFAYMEDVDFCQRLLDRGLVLLYQPKARIYHRVPVGPFVPSPFQIEHGARNRRRFVRRRLSWPERVRFAMFFYPTRGVRLAQYLLMGDLNRARALLRGISTR